MCARFSLVCVLCCVDIVVCVGGVLDALCSCVRACSTCVLFGPSMLCVSCVLGIPLWTSVGVACIGTHCEASACCKLRGLSGALSSGVSDDVGPVTVLLTIAGGYSRLPRSGRRVRGLLSWRFRAPRAHLRFNTCKFADRAVVTRASSTAEVAKCRGSGLMHLMCVCVFRSIAHVDESSGRQPLSRTPSSIVTWSLEVGGLLRTRFDGGINSGPHVVLMLFKTLVEELLCCNPS